MSKFSKSSVHVWIRCSLKWRLLKWLAPANQPTGYEFRKGAPFKDFNCGHIFAFFSSGPTFPRTAGPCPCLKALIHGRISIPFSPTQCFLERPAPSPPAYSNINIVGSPIQNLLTVGKLEESAISRRMVRDSHNEVGRPMAKVIS